MLIKVLLMFLCFGLLLCTGCGNAADSVAANSVMRDSFACQAELAAVLPSIKDEATAKAATPKLKALGARMQENSKRFEDLHLSEAQQAGLYEKYQPHLEEGIKVASEMLRVTRLNIDDKDFFDSLASCGASSATVHK